MMSALVLTSEYTMVTQVIASRAKASNPSVAMAVVATAVIDPLVVRDMTCGDIIMTQFMASEEGVADLSVVVVAAIVVPPLSQVTVGGFGPLGGPYDHHVLMGAPKLAIGTFASIVSSRILECGLGGFPSKAEEGMIGPTLELLRSGERWVIPTWWSRATLSTGRGPLTGWGILGEAQGPQDIFIEVTMRNGVEHAMVYVWAHFSKADLKQMTCGLPRRVFIEDAATYWLEVEDIAAAIAKDLELLAPATYLELAVTTLEE
ncbi:hypothetical protein GUJ93_ZPchr0004g39374 [Zizania palustris]|uniref:Uncharacterized protein n=1 Tax=Zizania palustris TaxID=103762 RepID=A0A8J5SYI1_ZIZPA|nr:hypothetical protein GUJ93_ZPchr0004g39374 [Zizania palustris]